ncbi:MAG: hypothetical protein M5U34_12725 [Chloroflexi bacterium]|nr:hypothetical protein [Chloroflexota bacterium]
MAYGKRVAASPSCHVPRLGEPGFSNLHFTPYANGSGANHVSGRY